jgi:nucleotidyltransferase/DNA polymerase involved in DNA repair
MQVARTIREQIRTEWSLTASVPLPVGRLPGVGKVTGEKLKSLQVQTIADLRALDVSTLERRFGRYGVRLHELARGIDNNEVIPDRPTQSAGCDPDRHGADDPASRGKNLGRIAQRPADRTHRGPQTEAKRVQDSHAQPYAQRSSDFLLGAEQHRSVATRARRPQSKAALSPRWRGVEQFSRSR